MMYDHIMCICFFTGRLRHQFFSNQQTNKNKSTHKQTLLFSPETLPRTRRTFSSVSVCIFGQNSFTDFVIGKIKAQSGV